MGVDFSIRLNVDWSKCYLEAPDGKYVDPRWLKSEDLEMQDEDGKPVGRVEIRSASSAICQTNILVVGWKLLESQI